MPKPGPETPKNGHTSPLTPARFFRDVKPLPLVGALRLRDDRYLTGHCVLLVEGGA